jgi:hypothetical protein
MIPKKFGYLGIANEAKPLGSEEHSTNIDHRHIGSGTGLTSPTAADRLQ